jgi:UDP-N-acetylmuramoylalanine--D-glutamate ligase
MAESLQGKTFVMLGLARQGIATTEWLATRAGANVIASDLRPREKLGEVADQLAALPNVRLVAGGHPLAMLDRADALILSGGVPLTVPIVQEAQRRGIPLTNDAQLFVERCPCHVVGITGSAGKTTTTTLVGKMMEAEGMLPWVGGNIGNPLISDLPFMRADDIAVMELSSFQLELMTISPHVGAVLNLTPNHLDRHGTMQAYTAAKATILTHQIVGDVAVLNRDDPRVMALAGRVRAKVVHFSARRPVDVGAWLVGDTLVCRPTFTTPMGEVATVEELPLRGQHNVLNVLAACAISGAAGVSTGAMREAALNFEGVAHRLEVVQRLAGVTYINDSIATAPERVVAAVKAFNEPLILLLGGRDKDLPWEDLMRLATEQAKRIVAFGEAGPMIAEVGGRIKERSGAATPIDLTPTLEAAFAHAAQHAAPGDVVLLSPGGTSFDAYPDFAARGEHFRELVHAL